MRSIAVCMVLLSALPAAAGETSGNPSLPPERSEPTAAAPTYPVVVIETDRGEIWIELFADKAPATVRNFLDYVEKSHYDSTIIHRVIPNFVIQGGGYDVDHRPRPTGPPVRCESANGLRNTRGTIAMARKRGRANTATSQFFINVVDNAMLDKDNADDGAGYTVFGRVIEGMEVVDEIRQVPTDKGPLAPHRPTQPKKPVVIKTVRVVR